MQAEHSVFNSTAPRTYAVRQRVRSLPATLAPVGRSAATGWGCYSYVDSVDTQRGCCFLQLLSRSDVSRFLANGGYHRG